jgi:hypothetical protein
LRSTGDGLAHIAHLGGMLFGLIYLKRAWRSASSTARSAGGCGDAVSRWSIAIGATATRAAPFTEPGCAVI